VERLVHFSCSACKKWWSIGDAPEDKKEWFCPWCGQMHITGPGPVIYPLIVGKEPYKDPLAKWKYWRLNDAGQTECSETPFDAP